MNIIKTLGPQTTDSFRAAQCWITDQGSNYQIECYSSIEKLFDSICKNDFVLMPVGYANRDSQEMRGWVDYHFKYIDEMQLVDTFVMKTKSMIVAENKSFIVNKAIIQSATYQMLKKYISDSVPVEYANSKSLALTKFLEDSYRYVVCSEDELSQRILESDDIEIIKKTTPEMIWVVYKILIPIKGEQK